MRLPGIEPLADTVALHLSQRRASFGKFEQHCKSTSCERAPEARFYVAALQLCSPALPLSMVAPGSIIILPPLAFGRTANYRRSVMAQIRPFAALRPRP